MKLLAWINGVSYPITQGNTFSEEFNETLDSGSIIISNVGFLDLKPFDDIIIYDAETQSGEDRVINGWKKGENHSDYFYKHLLISNVSEEILYLGDETGEFDENGFPIVENMIYKYKIEMFSEIKKMEKIILPNVSITQPLNEQYKKSVWQYLNQFLSLYNIKEKVSIGENKYEVRDKYILDSSLEEKLGNVYAPEFSLNTPSLRELLSKLFIVKDMIPYVVDDVIYGLDITKTNGLFNLNNGEYNYVGGAYSSNDYTYNLRRNYSDALSQESTGRSIEYIGFRNNDTPLMTFENMHLELEFPIYKINKIYMCYYKVTHGVDEYGNDVQNFMYLCQQDITPLVKLNSERNVLSEDWDKFKNNPPKTIEEMAKYKLCTLGYDIGSKRIEGWGSKYTYPRGWWQADKTASYLENILVCLDEISPNGKYYTNDFLEENSSVITIHDQKILAGVEDKLTSSIIPIENTEDEILGMDVRNFTYRMKTMFFIVDYTPFYSGVITHSKNFGERNTFLTTVDNASESLTLLEVDGVSQKEKLNRYGNKAFTIQARYTDISQLQPLGSIYARGKDKDIIIYHREYSIFNNFILCTYYGSKDYVLKNYFTTVYARHRTYNLMSYPESVKRAMNEKMFLLFSKDKAYYEKEKNFEFDLFDNTFYNSFVSFFKETDDIIKTDEFKNEDKYNVALFHYIYDNYDGTYSNGYLLKEVNAFASGNSLCFNITSSDNIASKPYIREFNPDFNLAVKDDMTGSVQDYVSFADKFGFTNVANFIIGHFSQNIINPEIQEYNFDRVQDYYKFLLSIPYVSGDDNYMKVFLNEFKNRIRLKNNSDIDIIDDELVLGGKVIHKDNKELIDMTYQFETITDDEENIKFSPWITKLSNTIGTYKKFKDTRTLTLQDYRDNFFETKIAPMVGQYANMIISFPKDSQFKFPDNENDEPLYYSLVGSSAKIINYDESPLNEDYRMTGLRIEFQRMKLYYEDSIRKCSFENDNGKMEATFYYQQKGQENVLYNTTTGYIEPNYEIYVLNDENGGNYVDETTFDFENNYYIGIIMKGFYLNLFTEYILFRNDLEGSYPVKITGNFIAITAGFDYSYPEYQVNKILGHLNKEYLTTVTYHKNMYLLKCPPMNRDTIYEEYKASEFDQIYTTQSNLINNLPDIEDFDEVLNTNYIEDDDVGIEIQLIENNYSLKELNKGQINILTTNIDLSTNEYKMYLSITNDNDVAVKYTINVNTTEFNKVITLQPLEVYSEDIILNDFTWSVDIGAYAHGYKSQIYEAEGVHTIGTLVEPQVTNILLLPNEISEIYCLNCRISNTNYSPVLCKVYANVENSFTEQNLVLEKRILGGMGEIEEIYLEKNTKYYVKVVFEATYFESSSTSFIAEHTLYNLDIPEIYGTLTEVEQGIYDLVYMVKNNNAFPVNVNVKMYASIDDKTNGIEPITEFDLQEQLLSNAVYTYTANDLGIDNVYMETTFSKFGYRQIGAGKNFKVKELQKPNITYSIVRNGNNLDLIYSVTNYNDVDCTLLLQIDSNEGYETTIEAGSIFTDTIYSFNKLNGTIRATLSADGYNIVSNEIEYEYELDNFEAEPIFEGELNRYVSPIEDNEVTYLLENYTVYNANNYTVTAKLCELIDNVPTVLKTFTIEANGSVSGNLEEVFYEENLNFRVIFSAIGFNDNYKDFNIQYNKLLEPIVEAQINSNNELDFAILNLNDLEVEADLYIDDSLVKTYQIAANGTSTSVTDGRVDLGDFKIQRNVKVVFNAVGRESSQIVKTIEYQWSENASIVSLAPVVNTTSITFSGYYTYKFYIINNNSHSVWAEIKINGITYIKQISGNNFINSSDIGTGQFINTSGSLDIYVKYYTASYKPVDKTTTLSYNSTYSVYRLRRNDLIEPAYLLINFANNFTQAGNSIRLYYKNNTDNSKNDDGNYHFVFGVNLTEEEYLNGEVKIYISSLTNQDLFIYDENHTLVGTMLNYKDSEIQYGEDNYYEDIKT